MRNLLAQLKVLQRLQHEGLLRLMERLYPPVPDELVVDEHELSRAEAVVSSMTPDERSSPELFILPPTAQGPYRTVGRKYNEARIARVAQGAGCQSKHVRMVVDRFFVLSRWLAQGRDLPSSRRLK